jgi:AcrR family transcriptional regulator
MTGKNADASVEKPDRRSVNHRTLVGKRRRAKTETKIIHAAIKIFAELGPDAPVIDDFIKAAGIARGTFYNYFKSTDELLRATSDFLSEELVMRIDKEIRSIKDPATRFGIGIRLWMRWAVAHPSWCLFLARVWNSIKYELPIGDIREGIAKNIFFAPDPYVAWDVISGAVRQAMFRIAEGNTDGSYGNSVAQMCLQVLGIRAEIIKDIMAMPLPDVPRGDSCQQAPASPDVASLT